MTALAIPALVRARLVRVFGPSVELTATRAWLSDRATITLTARCRGTPYRYSVTIAPADDDSVLAAWMNIIRWAEGKAECNARS